MKILYRRCAGLEVHKKSISACIRVRVHGHKVEAYSAVFGTVTEEYGCMYSCVLAFPFGEFAIQGGQLLGVDYITACALLAEIGVDMSVFPSANHLASWAGLCPGNSESAGKRMSGRTRKGSRYRRRLLIQNAWAVAHRKDGGLTAVFYRVAARRGMKKAALAVAHKTLVIAYYVVRDGVAYRDPGGDYFDRLHPERTAKRLAARLERIGFEVTLRPRSVIGTAHRQPPLSRAPLAPEHASGCKKCAAWGIPCIHARNRKRRPEDPLSN